MSITNSPFSRITYISLWGKCNDCNNLECVASRRASKVNPENGLVAAAKCCRMSDYSHFWQFLSKNYNFNFNTRYHNITSILRIVQYVQVNTRIISSNIKSFILEQNFRQKSQNKIFYFCKKSLQNDQSVSTCRRQVAVSMQSCRCLRLHYWHSWPFLSKNPSFTYGSQNCNFDEFF